MILDFAPCNLQETSEVGALYIGGYVVNVTIRPGLARVEPSTAPRRARESLLHESIEE
jgi:hypothetical protein